MSLRLHLPLNGNFRNYGLTPTNIDFTGQNEENLFQNMEPGKIMSIRSDLGYLSTDFKVDGMNSASVSFWLYVNSSDSDEGGVIIANGFESGIHIDITVNGSSCTLYPHIALGNGDVGTQLNINCNLWYNLCLVYNGSSMKAYINAVEQGEVTGIGSGQLYGSNDPINIGYCPECSTSDNFRAYLSDLRIYDHALSVKEVSEIYKNIILDYECDFLFGSKININNTEYDKVSDSSGYNRNGGAVNISMASSTQRGVDSYRFISNNSKIVTPVDFSIDNKTVSTWFKLNNTQGSQFIFYITDLCYMRVNSGFLSISGNSTSISIQAGRWYNVVISYENNILRIFLNGEFQTSILTDMGEITNQMMIIGNNNSGNYLQGVLGEFRVYGRALSDDECVLLYKSRAAIDKNYNLYAGGYDEIGSREEYSKLNNNNEISAANSNGVFTTSMLYERAGSNFKTFDGSPYEIYLNEYEEGLNFAGAIMTSEFIEN